ncbi:MAG: retropepsin-like aspartic protease [Nanoarchaeota archaeon]
MGKINFNKESNVIDVHIEIKNGNKTLRPKMALDTGATFVMIPLEIAETLGLHPELSQEKTEMITASGVEKVPIVTLKLVRFAGKEVTNVKAIVHDLPQKSYVDGLLGLSFLRNFNISINFKEGFIELN